MYVKSLNCQSGGCYKETLYNEMSFKCQSNGCYGQITCLVRRMLYASQEVAMSLRKLSV